MWQKIVLQLKSKLESNWIWTIRFLYSLVCSLCICTSIIKNNHNYTIQIIHLKKKKKEVQIINGISIYFFKTMHF